MENRNAPLITQTQPSVYDKIKKITALEFQSDSEIVPVNVFAFVSLVTVMLSIVTTPSFAGSTLILEDFNGNLTINRI